MRISAQDSHTHWRAWESSRQRKLHWSIGVLGGLGTIALWWMRLSRVAIPSKVEVSAALFLVPPYLMVFGLAHALSGRSIPPHATGPMSGYMQHEESGRKWRIRIVAGAVAAGNLLLLIFFTTASA